MKKYFIFSLAMAAVATMFSCSKDDTGGDDSPPAASVALSYELSNNSALAGGSVDVVFRVTSDALTEEDVAISLFALDGSTNVSSLYFVDFPNSLTFPKGEDEFTTTLTLKSDLSIDYTYKSIELQAYVSGYSLSGGTTTVSGAQSYSFHIYETYATTVSLKGDVTEVVEGATLQIAASIPVAGQSDVVVDISYSGSDFELVDLPTSITIAAGETYAESAAVTVADNGVYANNVTVTLDLSTSSAVYPLVSSELSFTVKDIDSPQGELAQDERYVYDNPNTMFVSSTNKGAVDSWGKSDYAIIEPGESHPNSALASTWKFYASYEFHNIASCYTANSTYGTKVANGFYANNTKLFESVAAVNINQFSTITEDGHLNMWVQKVPTSTTGSWGTSVTRDYGSAALYTSKFSAAQNSANSCYPSNTVRILPGTRVETRARIRGAKKGINSAIWLQGSAASTLAWPLYGEVDIMENPASSSTDNTTHYTYHIGENGSTYKNPTAKNTIINQDDFNIYWFEFIDESTVAIGVNGEEMNRITKSSYSSIWPFDTTTNPYGLYYLLTFGVASEWALGGSVSAGWDSGFSSYSNYAEDRYNENIPRMEIDWIRFYTTDSADRTQPVNTNKYY